MILVQNHLLPSNGNNRMKIIRSLYIATFLMGSLFANALKGQQPFQLNVGILLPFYSDTASSMGEREISQATLDFYAGMRIAAEDLNSWNVSVTFRVWDYRNMDDTALLRLPKTKEFQELDIFYGPITQRGVDLIASNLQHTQFIWVSPLKNLKLPKSVESVTIFSNDTLRIEGLIEALKYKFPSHQICLIFEKSQHSQLTHYRKHIKNQRFNVTEHQLIGGKISPKLPKSDDLLLVNVGTGSFSRISQFNAINRKPGAYVVGALNWLDDVTASESVDESKIIYPSVNFLNIEHPDVTQFANKFLQQERAEPSKFAFMGYDQLFVLGAHFASTGKISVSDMPKGSYQGLINTIDLRSIAPKTYENKGMRLIQQERVVLEALEGTDSVK